MSLIFTRKIFTSSCSMLFLVLLVAQTWPAVSARGVALHCFATPASAPTPAPVGIAGRIVTALATPMDSVAVTPGTIQAAIKAHGENTSFVLLPGIYTDSPVTPKNGDHFYGQGQATWDGGGQQQMAIVSRGTNHVLVSGIKFIHFNPPHHATGIFNLNQGETDFVLEDCEIAYNLGGTAVVIGSGTRIVNSSIHDNDDVGLGGYKLGFAVIDHNEIYNNYLAKVNPDTASGEAAGIKLMKTSMVSVTNNYVHDNYGVGVWFDTDNDRSIIDGNVISNNTHRGIMDETSYGAVVSNNTIIGNGKLAGSEWIGGAGLLLATAANVEVCNNIVKDNYSGVAAFQEDRGTGEHGAYATTHAAIHDNYITMTRGATGLAMNTERDDTNRFSKNHYCLTNDAGFLWGYKTDAKGWQAAGQDKDGTFDCGF